MLHSGGVQWRYFSSAKHDFEIKILYILLQINIQNIYQIVAMLKQTEQFSVFTFFFWDVGTFSKNPCIVQLRFLLESKTI